MTESMEDLYQRALAAATGLSSLAVQIGGKTVKLIAEKVTIYQSSDMFSVYSPKEASAWGIAEVTGHGGDKRIVTVFLPKGKKKPDHFVSPLRQDLLILKGYGHPETLYDGYDRAISKVQAAIDSGAAVILRQKNAPGG